MSIGVLIADDQPEVRSALRAIVGAHERFRVVGEAVDGLDAVGQAARRRPRVVLMDVRMPRLDGLEATRRIVAADAAVAVIVLTTYDLDEYVLGALRAGATGFLLKSSPARRIVEAVDAAVAGGGLIAPEVTRSLVAELTATALPRAGDPALDRLTPREREVLLAIARGLSNRQIAEELVLEASTVKSHVGRVLDKLGLRSRVQAVIYAYETGLVRTGAPAPGGEAAAGASRPRPSAATR